MFAIVFCLPPRPPANGSVAEYLHTRVGAIITYQCDDGFRPTATMTSICTNTTRWVPTPEQLNCVPYVAGIIITIF